MSRVVSGRPPRIALAQQGGLVYSDDYLDGWKWGFEKIGCEVREWDITPLHNIPLSRNTIYSARNWGDLPRGFARQILEWKPDLVWVHHGRYGIHISQYIQEAGVPIACYLCDEPYETGETMLYAPRYTHVFTMDHCTIPLHKGMRGNDSVFYLLPGVNTDRFSPGKHQRGYGPDGVFLGNASLVPRPWFFRHLESATNGKASLGIYYWNTVNKQHPGWIGLDKYPALLSSAKIGLNVHRSPIITEDCYKRRVMSGRNARTVLPEGFKFCSKEPKEWGTGFWNDLDLPASHINPRFFETGALGVFQISDSNRSELARLFPDSVVASNPEEFVEKFFYFLDHPEEREERAKQCCDLILSRHTYKHRCAEILLRVGLWESIPESLSSSLGLQGDWTHTQSFQSSPETSSSEPTGHSNSATQPTSRLLTPTSGTTKPNGSQQVRRL